MPQSDHFQIFLLFAIEMIFLSFLQKKKVLGPLGVKQEFVEVGLR